MSEIEKRSGYHHYRCVCYEKEHANLSQKKNKKLSLKSHRVGDHKYLLKWVVHGFESFLITTFSSIYMASVIQFPLQCVDIECNLNEKSHIEWRNRKKNFVS